MYRQPVLIYNPYAGKIRRNRERILQRTIAALGRAGMTPRVLPTDAAGHATELARTAIAEGADLVLALGGDGTLNEAANGMAHSGVPLGVLPAGTANVLANELGLGSRPDRAAEKLAKCEPKSVAMGRLTTPDGASRYFLCMAGAGLDAKIVRDVSSGLKDRTGKVAYWAAGLAQFPHRVEQLEVRVKGKVYRCGFALASRVRNYGGDLEIASGASLLRDDFEVVLFESANPLRYAWYMFGVGLRRVQRMQGVQTLSAQCAEILCGTDLQMDGEYAEASNRAARGNRPAGADAADSARLWITSHALADRADDGTHRPGANHRTGRHAHDDPGGEYPGHRRSGRRFSRQPAVPGSSSRLHAFSVHGANNGAGAALIGSLDFESLHQLAKLSGMPARRAEPFGSGFDQCLRGPCSAALFLALAPAGHDGYCRSLDSVDFYSGDGGSRR